MNRRSSRTIPSTCQIHILTYNAVSGAPERRRNGRSGSIPSVSDRVVFPSSISFDEAGIKTTGNVNLVVAPVIYRTREIPRAGHISAHRPSATGNVVDLSDGKWRE